MQWLSGESSRLKLREDLGMRRSCALRLATSHARRLENGQTCMRLSLKMGSKLEFLKRWIVGKSGRSLARTHVMRKRESSFDGQDRGEQFEVASGSVGN